MANSRLCSIPNCGKPHLARGWCSAHYNRRRNHGDPLGGGTPKGAALLFAQEAASYQKAACLFWPYAKNSDGYGNLWVSGAPTLAHRYVCKLAHGSAPSELHEAAHSCGNGHLGCVNPLHLSWKTRTENEKDKDAHGTKIKGEAHRSAKLTEDQVRKIRSLRGVLSQSQLAQIYGVSIPNISGIQQRKIWGWLPD